MTTPPSVEPISVMPSIDVACRRLVARRERPLMVLYYPDFFGVMLERDVQDCYRAFCDGGARWGTGAKGLDVLLHTSGGSPVAAYRLAQCIRGFFDDVTFPVPSSAYSAGTLLCLAGNEIRLGHCAGLSPIDVTMIDDQAGTGEVQLAAIDSFLEFSAACQGKIQNVLTKGGVGGIATVAEALLCELVDQIGAVQVGGYYRARTLTGHYAQELLDSYMFAATANRVGKRNRVIRELLFGKPIHEFHLDINLCRAIGLVVAEMTAHEMELTSEALAELQEGAFQGIICEPINDDLSTPFIAYFPKET